MGNEKRVESLREMYPTGTKLRLLSDIDDPYTPKFAGDILTVRCIDDIGQIHGSWKSGGSMAICDETDNYEIYKEI